MKPNKKDTAKLQKFFEEKDFVVQTVPLEEGESDGDSH